MGDPVDLLFKTPLDTSHPVDLRFGLDVVEVPGGGDIALAATLPAPKFVNTYLGNPRHITGAATLKAPTLRAVLTVPRQLALSSTLPKPKFATGSRIAHYRKITGAATLKAPTLTGHIIRPLVIALSATLPKPTLSGTFKHGYIIGGTAYLPKPKLTAGLKKSQLLGGTAKLPKPVLHGTFVHGRGIGGTAKLPKPHFVNALLISTPRIFGGTALLPKPSLHGQFAQDRKLHLIATLPAPTLRGQFHPGMHLSANAKLPAPVLHGNLEKPRSLVGNAILPTTLKLVGRIEHVHELTGSGTLSAPTLRGTLKYDNAVYRGPNLVFGSSYQEAKDLIARVQAPNSTATAKPLYVEGKHQTAKHAGTDVHQEWRTTLIVQNGLTTSHWDEALPLRDTVSSATDSAVPLKQTLSAHHDNALPIRNDYTSGFQDRYRFPRPDLRSWWGEGKRAGIDRSTTVQKGITVTASNESWWGEAGRPAPGGYTYVPPVVVEPPFDPCYHPPRGLAVPLVFADFLDFTKDLLFVCGDHGKPPAAATHIVPIKRTYIVLNDSHLIRMSDGLELPATNISFNIDMESWTWQFSANLPGYALDLVRPTTAGPRLLKIVCNGEEFMMLAEGIARQRGFAKSGITVSGRGQSATLTDPYVQDMTFGNASEMTAQQLMQDVLTINGASLGWDIDWRITDWVVPAGAFSHQGTYQTAVNAIAAAGGAFIQPDPVFKILRVRPRYPVAPWDFYESTTVPDLQLPTAAVITEGIDWADKPVYNSVYVSGTNAGGVLARVWRSGTAADVQAPMITDALITHADAARQRGLSVLADTGRIATYTLSMPVYAESGVVMPGSVVRYTEGTDLRIGIAKSVNVSVQEKTTSQSIQLEVHEAADV